MKYLIVGLVGFVGLGIFGLIQSRAFYESPDYTVISKDGNFEIREYQALKVVSAVDNGSTYRSRSAFSRLFGYISGNNSDNQKIAMTSPVFMSTDGDESKMSFVLPKEVAQRGAPIPERDDVKVEEMAGGRVLAYRFNGYLTDSTIREARTKLDEWVKTNEISTEGEVYAAGYDAPYTPASVRRNEILIRISK